MKKKIQVAKELSFDKETVANLDANNQQKIEGGAVMFGSKYTICSGSCANEEVEVVDGSCCKASCNLQVDEV